MTNLALSQNLHQHACDLENRLSYYRRQGQVNPLLEEKAHAVRSRYLETLGGAMTEDMEAKWTKTA